MSEVRGVDVSACSSISFCVEWRMLQEFGQHENHLGAGLGAVKEVRMALSSP